jgi:hypothetical protein
MSLQMVADEPSPAAHTTTTITGDPVEGTLPFAATARPRSLPTARRARAVHSFT